MTNMLALLAIGALATWLLGSIIARVAGALIVLEFLLRFAITDNARQPAHYGWLATGVGLWLFGHWMWAYKHRTWRSSLVLKAFSTPGLHRLAPIAINHRPRAHAPQWVRQNVRSYR
ncbi:hypothetical protein ACFYVR_24940 [Rhodococcus sp. NPDC003318]|uniref:hypothetical protein n=1 Tax=Rhodococcus sp. NPDC003318 TaxID=3364503 RepID=UPI00367C4A56